ncbi:MAG: hypothetical protein ABJA79_02700 [Parafilimonas sp.]
MKTKTFQILTVCNINLCKSTLLIFIFSGIVCFAFSQRITATSVNSPSGTITKTITYDPMGGLNCASYNAANPGLARISLFTELGDGNYILDNCSGTNTYTVAAGSQVSVTAKASGIYDDGGGRPKLLSLVISGADGSSKPIDAKLSAGENIKLTPNVSSVVAGDTMTFAIGYRPNYGSGTIALVYNNGRQIFTAPASVQCKNDAGSNVSFPFYRRYRNETLISNIPQSLIDMIRPYQNITAFNLNANNDSSSKNIFVTLVPSNLTPWTGTTSLKAILIQGHDTSYSQPVTLDLRASHDPNNMIVDPACMRPSDNSDIVYTVNFQNEGNLVEDNITLDVFLPKEVEVTNFECELAGIRILRLGDPDLLVLPRDAATGMQRFVIHNAHLRGTHENSVDINSTMGKLTITARVLPAFSNAATEKTLVAHTDVFFGAQPAVTTNTADIKLSGDCTEIGCKCDNKCTYLYIIIFVLLLLLLFALMRIWRRRN